ncbi:protein FAM53B [Aplochiton taeniatus]
MCVAMVIIYSKTLEKKVVDDVTSKGSDLGLFQAQNMSQGTALFSCGLMEASRWRDVGRGCAMQQRPSVGSSLESLWDQSPTAPWGWEVGPGGTITSLLQDLSLSQAAASPSAAPPSKRQCRSLSCSDELGGCRSGWRPQGSRVWTAVEKRRCHSGGSVQRGGGPAGFPAMQRSSSFSLPARSNTLELPCFSQRLPCPTAFTGQTPSRSLSSVLPPLPLYLSHEQICLPEAEGGPSPCSSPDSTPELERRGGSSSGGQGGLARSRSQPCVLNDKKIGMKRRRPADTHKQRPSLDLAKMTMKLRNFQSLSCPGIAGEDCCQSSPAQPILRSTAQCETDQRLGILSRTKEGGITTQGGVDPAIEEPGWNSPVSNDMTEGTANWKEREPLWAELCSTRKDQLGGELDIEQIERN